MIHVDTPNYVEMDSAHIELIKGMALALKPKRILELGIGSGKVTTALLDACAYNGMGTVQVVDNWLDWGGKQPEIHGFDRYANHLTITTANEEDFVNRPENAEQFDLIVSDADHLNSHRWWKSTLGMLTFSGVAFFHDVCNPDFDNLKFLPYEIEETTQYLTKVFKASSRPFERCQRGLLMVCKN